MANLLPQYPTGLNEIFMSPNTFLAQQGVDQFNTAQETAKLNQKMGLQDYLFNEQNNPLKLEQQRLSNRTAEVQIPGFEADAQRKVRDNQVRQGIPMEEEVKSKRAELAKAVSDSELTQVENAVKIGLQDPSPQVRAMANAMWENLSEIKKLKLEHTNRLDIARIGADARVSAGAGRVDRPAPTFADQFGKLKKAHEKHAALLAEVARLQQAEPTNPNIAIYSAMAESLKAQAEAELQTTPAPGKPNLAALPGTGIVVNPNRQITPLTPGQAPGQPAASAKLADVQKMYPGVPPEKLREAYKRKFGVDLQ